MILLLVAKLNLPRVAQRYASHDPILNAPNTMPTTRIHLQWSPTITTNLDFLWACYTAYLMLAVLLAGVGVSASCVARKQLSRDRSLVFLMTSGYTVLTWLLILIGIHACWPDGWIYKRRLRKRLGGGGGGEMGMAGRADAVCRPPWSREA